MSSLDLDGRVAIVTGAGGGLGRSHARLLAERGARVVVNDPGVARDGVGEDARPADTVVAEIEEAGGEAVANHDGVDTWEGGQAIVDTALSTYGRVDIVVNNAGILRDRTFANLTDDDVEAVLRVHLLGAFHVTRAAWSHLKEQGYGRVVSTTSGSGLYGNVGQANYGAAKLGLVGLTRTLALEGARYGITANAIAPIARSRMTEDIMPPALLDRLGPDHVAPIVGYLVSEACTDSGRIYAVGGGYVSRVAILEGTGVTFDEVPSVEEVAARWDAVQELGDGATEPTRGVMDQTARMADALGIDLG